MFSHRNKKNIFLDFINPYYQQLQNFHHNSYTVPSLFPCRMLKTLKSSMAYVDICIQAPDKVLLNQKVLRYSWLYLEFQGTHWTTSRYPYLDISDLQN